ncbi:hypothetical protein FQ085_16110 [Planococcus sp. ANT_H30]|uniref:Adenylate kinase n=1 Tax=Planococcus kocurii TaxID=1374 RepID=A0ABM5WWM7_9BACL|nr:MULTISPECIES: hypothetical protein [Planococcus]ALS78750.1 hypothetical protein AUO94_08825 [Planococcus kocurii]KAA0955194.1 hypothetical protein FQ085_16110 [Planococcus sp. ANT_H30]
MNSKIHIMGAAGSGTTTLGNSLANVLPYTHLDTDDYFWKTKFTEQRSTLERQEMLKEDLSRDDQCILTGAVAGWGNCFVPYFNLVIFLWIPSEVRLARLQEREIERYGNAVSPSGSRYEESQVFLKWASLYDHAGMEVRSKALHEQWMAELSCPLLRIEGDYSIEERVAKVMNYLNRNNSSQI